MRTMRSILALWLVTLATAAHAQSWTAPRTWVHGELVTEGLLNAQIRDNELILKTSIASDGTIAATSPIDVTATFAAPASGHARIAANATNGALVGGYGSTYDTALVNRAGTVALGVTANTANLVALGTFSTAGTITVSAGNNAAVLSSSTTTGWQELKFANNNAGFHFALEGSAGGSLATGTTAYNGVINMAQAYGIQFATNNTVRWNIDSGGNFLPGADGNYNIGSASYQAANIFTAGIRFTDGVTSTGTAIIWDAGTSQLRKQTSSARYKEHIVPFSVSDEALAAFVALSPDWWDYRGQQTGASGFIAEHLAALPITNAYGVSPLVNYDNAGRPDSNRDFALIGLQHLVLQKHDAALAALTARIAALEAR